MDKQDFLFFSIVGSVICLLAIGLVIIAPQAGQVVVLMLTVPSLIMIGAWAIIRKVYGE